MSSKNAELYDRDFFAWTQNTAELLRKGSYSDVDPETLAGEIEDMGKRDLREVNSHLRVLIMHLLKWQYQPDGRGGSWQSTINTQRFELEGVFEQSPSLRTRFIPHLAKTYARARFEASAETGLDERVFPQECPYTVEQILDRSFFAGA